MYCGLLTKSVNGLECARDLTLRTIQIGILFKGLRLASYTAKREAIIRRLGTYNTRRNVIEGEIQTDRRYNNE